ncbi:MAG: hypothetical protein ACAI44_30415, partial [Candidatus Sericytochromatia bacterium]
MDMPALSEADENLQEILLQERVLEARQLNQALAARDQGWQRAIRRFVGLYCSVDTGLLSILEFSKQRELASFELAYAADPDQQPVTLFYLSPEGGLERATLLSSETGLLLTHEGCWIQTRDPLDMPLLGMTQRLQILPGHDLAISPRRDVLAISEREAGRIRIVSLNRPQILASLDVRDPGSHKAINLCFQAPQKGQQGRLWFSDQESDRLGLIEAGSWEPGWVDTGLGRLGQLLLEGEALYVLALTPMLRLARIDPVSLEVSGELDLPGTPASLAPGVPTDVLERDPGSGDLLVLTQQHGQSAPDLLRISPDLKLRGEPVPVPPVAGWAMLVPGQVNPVQKWATRRLDDWIAELEFLSAEHLARLRQEARFGSLMGPRTSSFEVPQGHEDPADTLCRQAPPITLPAETVPVLVEMLAQGFFQETGQNLHGYPREMERLREEATEMKQELEKRYIAIAGLEQVLGKHSLQLVISRDLLLRSLDYHLGGKVLPFRPGHLCPICALRVKNPRQCPSCGFELDAPEWRERRRNQSAEACDELIPGQMVYALPHARQIVFLDAWLQVISELSAHSKVEDNPLREPVHVLALPEGSWLVCDAEAAKVYEITPGGELLNVLDQPFQDPLLATFRRSDGELTDLVVLDAGANEIFSFTREGQPRQSWGAAEGLRLNAP